MANCGEFGLQKLRYVVCALLVPGLVGVAWKRSKAMHFWKSGFKFVFGRQNVRFWKS